MDAQRAAQLVEKLVMQLAGWKDGDWVELSGYYLVKLWGEPMDWLLGNQLAGLSVGWLVMMWAVRMAWNWAVKMVDRLVQRMGS
jgi:hypothetical protein